MLIALFERTVGLYASLIGINAYHQPGVEAGKKAASSVIALQGRVRAHLAAHPKESFTAAQLAAGLGAPDAAELVFKLCEHLAANPGRGVKKTGGAATAAQFSLGAN
jgi:glucose-6-phosphate isomerase